MYDVVCIFYHIYIMYCYIIIYNPYRSIPISAKIIATKCHKWSSAFCFWGLFAPACLPCTIFISICCSLAWSSTLCCSSCQVISPKWNHQGFRGATHKIFHETVFNVKVQNCAEKKMEHIGTPDPILRDMRHHPTVTVICFTAKRSLSQP